MIHRKVRLTDSVLGELFLHGSPGKNQVYIPGKQSCNVSAQTVVVLVLEVHAEAKELN